MAPEQLEGRAVGSASDIFAFGAVLYEMLTGQKAFEGNSRISLASAIVRDTPPPVSTLVATTGDRAAGTKRLRTLDRLVATCLAKDPEDRWQATRDLWRELKWIARSEGKDEDGRGPASTSEAIRPRARRQIPLAWSAALTAIAAMLAAIAVWMAMPRSQQTTDTSPVMQVAVSLPRGEELAHFGAFALSSDGARIAYVSTRAGQAPRLHVRTMASGAIVDIPGGDGAFEPFFSPDDQWIGFFANGKLKKALANGGAAQTLCDAVAPMGGAWGPDDTIYFAPFNTSGLWSVSSAGGTPKAITSLNRGTGETSHRWPHVLPGGTAILFTIWTGPGWDEHELQVLTLATGERRNITRGATAGQYVASGHIVYSRADVLMAVPFDLSRLQATAAPYELRERVLEEDGSEFAVSATGLLAYVAVSPQRLQRQLVWVDGNGHVDEIPASPRPYLDPAVSPDGRLAVVSVQGPVQTLWVYDFARRTLTPLTSANVGSSQAPVWTPDGTRLAYRGTRHGFRNLFVRSGDGSDDEERLTTSENLQTPSSWTPDGKKPRLHGSRSRHGCRHLCAVARRANLEIVDPHARHRTKPLVIARRPLAGVRIQRIRGRRGVCAAIRGSRSEAPGIHRRRKRTVLVETRAPAHLPKQRSDHGSADRHSASAVGRRVGRAVQRTLQSNRYRRHARLRHRSRRPVADGAAARTGTASHRHQPRDQLVRRNQEPRPHAALTVYNRSARTVSDAPAFSQSSSDRLG